MGKPLTKDNSGLALGLSFPWKTEFPVWLVPHLRRSLSGVCLSRDRGQVQCNPWSQGLIQASWDTSRWDLGGLGQAHSPCTHTYTDKGLSA